jgi:tetratricopeptide (TPR) repeat protein
MMVGDANQAEKLIQSELKANPTDPATLRLAATFYVGQGRTDQVEPILTKLLEPATKASQDDLAWANRTRGLMFLTTGQSASVDEALRLVKQNLKNNPFNLDDQRLLAVLLAMRSSRRGEAIQILEPLESSNLLDSDLQFLLAKLYLGEREEVKYRGEMLKILDRKLRNPQHLAHYIGFLISRNELDQADRWLTELKRVEPQGLLALQLEAGLLDKRRRKPELLALLEARGRQVPDQIGPVADLLDRYGFTKEAEAAYKAFIARDPKQPERVLALVPLLGRQGRVAEAIKILSNAHATCRPEQVATYALSLYDAPSVDEDQRRQVEAWVAEASQRRPEMVSLSVRLGAIWTRQGRFDEVESLYRGILGKQPDNAEALNNLAFLVAIRDEKGILEARELIDRAIELAGPNAALADTRAVVLIRSGQLDQAERELLNAQQGDPENRSLAFHLAWVYQLRRELDRAQRAFRKAESLGLRPQRLDPLERRIFERVRNELFPGQVP